MEKNIIKIGVIGAESTGKSSLCRLLANHYNTLWVPEFSREYFNTRDINNYSLSDLIIIADNQIKSELKKIKKATRFLFCDTTLITLKIWAELEFNKTPEFISDNLHKIKYDYYLITANDVEWEKDNQRKNKFNRDLILKLNINEVEKLNSSFSIINGVNDTRLNNSVKILDALF
jgi:NadR type nicotinamide-nucleotide adenylyltransferase